MDWVLLSIAGVLEIGFAFCMKWSEGFTRLMPGVFAVITGSIKCVFLLSLSLRTLPVGKWDTKSGPVSARRAPRFWE